MTENERLSKNLHQRKSEYEVLKDKYEAQQTQKSSYLTEFEYEKKKLIKEIDNLEGELNEVERIKNSQIQELKAQFQLEIQGVKRQSQSTQEVYEQELRKLRDSVEKKEYEINEIANRLKRISSESEYEILRLKEEK